MISEQVISYGAAGLAAAIPIAIWIYILFKQEAGSRWYYFWSFLGGVLAVLALMGLQQVWVKYPEYDPFEFFTKDIADPGLFFAVTFVIVGVLEEIAKQLLLRHLDTKKAVVKSINDSIRFSLVAALGFAFAENIFYFHSTYSTYGGFSGVLLITYIFRSVFTAAGHMCFSGIFGYYYGMSRFSASIKNEATLEGKSFGFTNLVARIFSAAQSQVFRTELVIKGLVISIVLHGVFNFILSLEQVIEISAQIPSILAMVLVSISFSYLYFLRKRKTVETEMLTDISTVSNAMKKDESERIAEELMSQWLKEKKYKDVIQTAERLLKKNPNNETAKILMSKANDALKGADSLIDQTITTFVPGHEQKIESKDQSVLDKYQKSKDKEAKVEIDKEKDDEVYHL